MCGKVRMLNWLPDGISHNFLLPRGSYVNLFQTEFLLYFISELQTGFPFRGQASASPWISPPQRWWLLSPMVTSSAGGTRSTRKTHQWLDLNCSLCALGFIENIWQPWPFCPFAKYIEVGRNWRSSLQSSVVMEGGPDIGLTSGSIWLSQKRIDGALSRVGRSPPLQDIMLSFLGLRLRKCPLPHLRDVASPQIGITTHLPFGSIPPCFPMKVDFTAQNVELCKESKNEQEWESLWCDLLRPLFLKRDFYPN